MFLPKKFPKSTILNPQKSFDHPGHLKSGVPPLPNSSYKSSKIYKLLWTWRIKMVDKRDFYTVNVSKIQISTLKQSAYHCWKILLSVH